MKSLKRPWANLILAPIWFLFAIVAVSIYFGGQGVAEADMPAKIQGNIPALLLIVQLLLLLFLYLTAKKDNFDIFKNGWSIADSSEKNKNILYGIGAGVLLALAYFGLLSPLQIFLQENIGDYIPPGETMGGLGTQAITFFVANVVLAPFVEESLYRNYTLTRFLEKYSPTKAIVLNSIFFGLLHWMGGFWYILMTGLFIGVPFAIIAVRKKNIVWVFAAHLTLNLMEFVYITVKA